MNLSLSYLRGEREIDPDRNRNPSRKPDECYMDDTDEGVYK